LGGLCQGRGDKGLLGQVLVMGRFKVSGWREANDRFWGLGYKKKGHVLNRKGEGEKPKLTGLCRRVSGEEESKQKRDTLLWET